MGVELAGPREEKAIVRFFHDPLAPRRVDDSRTQGSPKPTAPALRDPHPLGAGGHPDAGVECGWTNNCENAVFLLKLPGADLPSRITERGSKQTVLVSQTDSRFPFHSSISRLPFLLPPELQTTVWLRYGTAHETHTSARCAG